MQDALQRLGLRAGGFDDESLKKAFLEESRRNHPDRGGTNKDFRLLVSSYKTLKTFLKESMPPPLHNESKVSSLAYVPIDKNVRKMDPVTFNKVFSSTHTRDVNGHGEWLSNAPTSTQSKINFKNFNKAFQKQAQKQSLSLIVRSSPVVPSSSCSLSPLLTGAEPTGANADFSSPPSTGRSSSLAYSDLKVTHDQYLVDPTEAEKFASMKRPLLQSLLEENSRQ